MPYNDPILAMRMLMKAGRLQKYQWDAELNIEPKVYQTRSHLKKTKMQNRHDPVSFVEVDGVKQEE
jgi:hypothetical protein